MAERSQLTYRDVAAATGIDKNTIGNFLKGKAVKTDTVQRFADYFDVDISEFFVTPMQADLLRRASAAHVLLVGQPVMPAAPPPPSQDTIEALARKVMESMAPMVAQIVSATLVGERTGAGMARPEPASARSPKEPREQFRRARRPMGNEGQGGDPPQQGA